MGTWMNTWMNTNKIASLNSKLYLKSSRLPLTTQYCIISQVSHWLGAWCIWQNPCQWVGSLLSRSALQRRICEASWGFCSSRNRCWILLDDVGSGQWFPPATTQHQPALPCPAREPEEIQSRFMTSLIGATHHFTPQKEKACKSFRNVVTLAIAWFLIQNAPSVFLETLTSAACPSKLTIQCSYGSHGALNSS